MILHVSSETFPISIHALREEGDVSGFMDGLDFDDFYPRPPRGGRPFKYVAPVAGALFLSTPSARRATSLSTMSRMNHAISIHALREEGDRPGVLHIGHTFQFLSTPSARRATGGAFSWLQKIYKFLSTPSARRATIPLCLTRSS